MKIVRYFIVLFLLSIVKESVANHVQLCHTNPCQNDGNCYKVGDSVEHSNCEDGWTLYLRTCYKLVQSAQSWSDAFRHCRSSQSNLLSIESAEERMFVKEFAKDELKPSSGQNLGGRYPFNVWTSGKLFDNSDSALWAWLKSDNNETIDLDRQYWKSDYHNPIDMPENGNNSSINVWLSGRVFDQGGARRDKSFFWLKGYDKQSVLTHFWGDNVLTAAILTNDACISVASSTNYTDWIVDSCEQKRNYFICEKPESFVLEPNGYYDYQCRCKPGFAGFNCETSVTDSYISHQQQICDAEPFKFSCPLNGSNKRIIVVEYVSYGIVKSNSTSKKCVGGKNEPSNIADCVADNGLKLIAKHCQGQTSCSLPMPKKLFPVNPCLPGSSGLTLEYRLRCVEEELTCPSDTVQHNKFCYEVTYRDDRSSRKSWADARKYCQSKGGDLIGPMDAAAHNALINALHQKDERKVKYFWIGLKMNLDYRSQQATGYFVNGAPMEFSPEGSRLEDDECVAYYVQPPSRIVWLAKNCNYFYNWICQYSLSGPERPKLQDPLWTKPTEGRVSPDEEDELTTTAMKPMKTDSESSVAFTSAELTTVTTTAATPLVEYTTPKKKMTTTRVRTVDQGDYYTQQRTTRRATRRTTITARTKSTVRLTRPTTRAPSTVDESESAYPTVTKVPAEYTEENSVATNPYTDSETDTVAYTDNSSMTPEVTYFGVWSVSVSYNSTTTTTTTTSTTTTATTTTTTTTITPVSTTTETPTAGSTTVQTTSQISSFSNYTIEPTVDSTTVTEDQWDNSNSNRYRTSTPLTTIAFNVDNAPVGICYNKTVRNILWPNTFESQVATVACPNSKHRFAYWGCMRDNDGEVRFYPENPDLSDCRNDKLLDALRDQISSDESALKITTDLATFWQSNKNAVYGGDIYASLYMIKDIINLQRRQLQKLVLTTNPYEKQAVSTKFTQKLGSVVDVLLSSEVIPVWNDLPGNYKYGNATVLMYNLEDNADMLAYYLESTFERNFTFDSLSMKVEVYRQPGAASPASPVATAFNESVLPASVQGDGVVLEPYHRVGAADAGHNIRGSDTRPVFTPPSTISLNGAQSRLAVPVNGLLNAITTQQNNGQWNQPDSTTYSGFMPVTANDGADDDHSLRVSMFEYGGGLSSLLTPAGQGITATSGRLGSKPSVNNNVIVNSRVVTASVNNHRTLILLPDNQLTNFVLNHSFTNNVKNPKCVYWNTTLTSWDSWGCNVTESTKEYTVCTCNHLTSFAVLMDVTGALEQISQTHKEILTYITVVGCSISIVCLIICILVFSCFRTLWNERNTIHRNLCICLLIGELLYVCGIDRVESRDVCTSVAVLLQYFFLAAFCWMLMEGYQLYRMLIKVFETERSMVVIYYSIAYGCPAIITAVSVGVRLTDYGTDKYCWINVHSATVWAFAAPVALVIFINVIFLGLALKAVLSVSSSRHEKSKFQKMKGWLKGSTMLLSLLGITWIFGFCFTIQPAALYFAYIFAISNSLQGVFIFAFHVVLNEKCHSSIVRSIRRTCPNFMPRKGDSLASNSTGSTNLKKLSDSMRNSNSLAVGLKNIDTNLGRPNNTFFINHALAGSAPLPLYNKADRFTPMEDENNSASAAISIDKSHFAPIIVQREQPLTGGGRLAADDDSLAPQVVRQRYSKNAARVNRRDTDDSEMPMTMNNNCFDGGTTFRNGPHVLTIPTGEQNGNDARNDLLNTLGRSKNDFVGHF